jgi:hypothetical protein
MAGAGLAVVRNSSFQPGLDMAIEIQCACGKLCRAKDEAAGKRVRCPQCGTILNVPCPVAPPTEPVDFDLPAPGPVPLGPPPIPAARPALPPAPVNWSAPAMPMHPGAGGAAPLAPLSLPYATPRPIAPRPVVQKGWFGSVNGGAIGGLATIGIAIAWLVVGLMLGRLFIYPFILIVIGLVAVIKGLAGAN